VVRHVEPGWRTASLSYVVLWRIPVYHDEVRPQHVAELVCRNLASALTTPALGSGRG
jgi:hypothetical protein